jgi:hypothetical protein
MTTTRSLLSAIALSVIGALGCASSHSSPTWPATPVAATELVRFDPSQGALSEGLALRGRTAYFGYASTGQVVAVDLDSAKVTPYSTLPQPAAGKGFVTGLALRGETLYGGLASFVPEVQAGIYKVGTPGAPATLYAKHAEMAFPNGLAFDAGGTLYVTDSAAGAIFRVSTTGEATKWASDGLLLGGKDGCGAGQGVGVPFDIGANGVAVTSDALYVTNTDKGTVLRIPVGRDGNAGAVAVVAGPSCAELNGADGMTIAANGDLIVAVNHQNKLVRVNSAGQVSTLLAGSTLDFPSSLAFADDGALYISNFSLLDGKNPGLLQVR